MRKPRVLVVEDEGIVAKALANCLEELGCEVTADCDTGEAALEHAARARPDLVLMDIGLSGALDGVETAIHLWNRFRLPILFLSGHADEATLERATLAHPIGYLPKPFTDDTLQGAIERALAAVGAKPVPGS